MYKIIAFSDTWLNIVFQEMNHSQEVSHLIGQKIEYRALVNETSNPSICVFFCNRSVETNPKWSEASVHFLVQESGQRGFPLSGHCWLWSS